MAPVLEPELSTSIAVNSVKKLLLTSIEYRRNHSKNLETSSSLVSESVVFLNGFLIKCLK